MVNLRHLFLVALTVSCAFVSAQNSDIGYDWDTSKADPDKLIRATSESIFAEGELSYQINFNLDYQVNIEVGGGGIAKAPRHNDVYVNDGTVYKSSTHSHSYIQLAGGTNVDYLEGYVKDSKNITAFKFNGTTASTSKGTSAGLLYSDKTPFDATSVIGYGTVDLPACRAGGNGVALTTIPAGTKSFRVYGKAQIVANQTGGYEVKNSETDGDGNTVKPEGAIEVGTGDASARIAYINITVGDAATSINDIAADNKEIASKTYIDINGRVVSALGAKGLLIQKVVYTDGSISFEKILIAK